MIQKKDFKKEADKVLQWADNYIDNLKQYPVKSQVKPGEIYRQLPAEAPAEAENVDRILKDLDDIIMPGVTHWQSPNFHAYFPTNSSFECLLSEIVMATLNAQCMVWETSPAAAELEQRMMEWLRDACGLPHAWQGVIQDSASSATLAAMVTAREVATGFRSNHIGVPGNLRVYCSAEAHSSIEKGAGVCGIGRDNVRKIATDAQMRMDPAALRRVIEEDLALGNVPCMVVAAIGTTGTVAVDPLKEIAAICKQYHIWLHVDAAYAGSALLLPEYRWMIDGVEDACSLVFNPHKWLYTAFDCSAFFIKDAAQLIRTFDILPEYLKTATHGTVNDYRDWGIPLGRRFRSLKLWFVLRGFGMDALRAKLREQIGFGEYFAGQIARNGDIEILREPFLSFVCFRYRASNEENERRLEAINNGGKAYLSHTKVGDRYALRFHGTQTYTTKEAIDLTIKVVLDQCRK